MALPNVNGLFPGVVCLAAPNVKPDVGLSEEEEVDVDEGPNEKPDFSTAGVLADETPKRDAEGPVPVLVLVAKGLEVELEEEEPKSVDAIGPLLNALPNVGTGAESFFSSFSSSAFSAGSESFVSGFEPNAEVAADGNENEPGLAAGAAEKSGVKPPVAGLDDVDEVEEVDVVEPPKLKPPEGGLGAAGGGAPNPEKPPVAGLGADAGAPKPEKLLGGVGSGVAEVAGVGAAVAAVVSNSDCTPIRCERYCSSSPARSRKGSSSTAFVRALTKEALRPRREV